MGLATFFLLSILRRTTAAHTTDAHVVVKGRIARLTAGKGETQVLIRPWI